MNKYKKSIILFAAFFFVSLQAFSQNSPVDKFFNQYANDDRFTFVSVSPQMMQQFLNEGANAFMATNIKSMRILTTDATPQQFYQEAVSALDAPPYEETMNVRKEDKAVMFLARKENGKIVETVMIISKEDKFTLIDMTGDNLDLNNLGN